MTADFAEPSDNDERHVGDWSVLAPLSSELADEDDPAYVVACLVVSPRH
jgi:hypothetical protein